MALLFFPKSCFAPLAPASLWSAGVCGDSQCYCPGCVPRVHRLVVTSRPLPMAALSQSSHHRERSRSDASGNTPPTLGTCLPALFCPHGARRVVSHGPVTGTMQSHPDHTQGPAAGCAASPCPPTPQPWIVCAPDTD